MASASAWTDNAKDYKSDWTWWGGDSAHQAGWYGLSDVQSWTPQDQWDPSKYTTHSGWSYDFASGRNGIVDPTTGLVWSRGVDPFTGGHLMHGQPVEWTPEMQEQYGQWFGQQQAAAGAKTANAGAKTSYYGDPDAAYAAGQLAGSQAFGRGATAAANATKNYTNGQGALSDPGDAESLWNDVKGQLLTPSYAEQLYESGNSGLNDAYKRAWLQTRKALNDEFASRHLFNSTAATTELEGAAQDIFGQQAKMDTQLAATADTQRNARLGLAGTLANTAQGREEGRYKDALAALSALGKTQASYTGSALDGFTSDDKDLVQAMIQAGVITPAEIDAAARQGAINNAIGMFKAIMASRGGGK